MLELRMRVGNLIRNHPRHSNGLKTLDNFYAFGSALAEIGHDRRTEVLASAAREAGHLDGLHMRSKAITIQPEDPRGLSKLLDPVMGVRRALARESA
jgi:hypothetical protein